jgi:hypothetical protein
MDPEQVMSGDNQGIEIILVRMEGKIDRMNDRQERYERDQSAIRARLHDLANEVTPIVMLDLPGRIRTADQDKAQTHSRLSALEAIEQQRKGAAALAKILWVVLGAAGTGTVAVLVRIMGA